MASSTSLENSVCVSNIWKNEPKQVKEHRAYLQQVEITNQILGSMLRKAKVEKEVIDYVITSLPSLFLELSKDYTLEQVRHGLKEYSRLKISSGRTPNINEMLQSIDPQIDIPEFMAKLGNNKY